jgi:hypothetical protein
MQDDSNRKQEKRGMMAFGEVDSGRTVGDSIRQAFLTHMGEQQRQFPMMTAKSTVERVEAKKR